MPLINYSLYSRQETGESTMAFGQKAQAYKDKPTTGTSTGGDGEKKQFDSQWMPTGSGARIFRPLLDVVDGELVQTERKSASGKPIREGGKKTGAILLGPEPASETVFLAAWWEVRVGDGRGLRRIMLDPMAGGDPNTAKFKNPLWQFISDNYAKGSRERNAIKTLFALNVYDMTPVMRNETGQLFYPAEDGQWRLLAFGNNGKLIDAKDKQIKLPVHYKMDLEDALEAGHAEPLNKIRILEGSYGKPGGKHLFAQFEQLANTVEDADGITRRLGEFNLRLFTSGEGMDTVRAIRNLNNFNPLPNDVQFAARYDLDKWTRPWPDEAVQRLLDDEDYNEIVKEYELEQFPTFVETDTAYTGKTEKLDPSVVEDEDEGLFEE